MNYSEKLQSEIMDALASLGYATLTSVRVPLNVDPEWTIIKGLSFLPEQKSIFDITVSLVEHRLHGFINTERLIAISKTQHETVQTLISYLGARCAHLDQRFMNLSRRNFQGTLDLNSAKLERYQLPRYFRKWGKDPHFAKLGIDLPNFFGEDKKKFYLEKAILNANPWLRLRSLVGPTYRADIVFLMKSGRANRPQETKILGCQRATAYKLWRQLESIPYLDNNPLFEKYKAFRSSVL